MFRPDKTYGAKKWDTVTHQQATETIRHEINSKAFEIVEGGRFNGEYVPVGYMKQDVQSLTGAKTGLVYMSGATAAKQRTTHSDLTPDTYKVIQGIFDKGKIIQAAKTKPTDNDVFIGFGEMQGRWWRIAWKVVDDEVWFLSLTKTIKRKAKLRPGENLLRE